MWLSFGTAGATGEKEKSRPFALSGWYVSSLVGRADIPQPMQAIPSGRHRSARSTRGQPIVKRGHIAERPITYALLAMNGRKVHVSLVRPVEELVYHSGFCGVCRGSEQGVRSAPLVRVGLGRNRPR